VKSKEEKKVQARARVLLTLEVDLSGRWGSDCTVGQVHDQAGREAVDKVFRLVKGGTVDTDPRKEVRLVGTPRVTAVLVDELQEVTS